MSRGIPRTSSWGLWLALVPLALFLAAPLLGLASVVRWSELPARAVRPEVVQAVTLSLGTTALATVISVLLGLPAAWLLARQRGPAIRWLEFLFDLPLILPPAVAGLGLLCLLGRNGLLGQGLAVVGVTLPFTTAAVVLAQIFVGAPLFVKCATGGLAAVPQELIESAAVMGASPWRMLVSIGIPMAWPAILTGALSCWARALGEFGATLLFAGSFPGRTQTMPLAIYQLMESDFRAAVELAFVLVAISLAMLGVIRRGGG
jgi:molybdate transport system permease protein